MGDSNKSRFNITLSNEIKEWYVKRAESIGVPISSLMTMALVQYKEQYEGIKAMSSMSEYMEQIQSLQNIMNGNNNE
jgi:hypothetical protein